MKRKRKGNRHWPMAAPEHAHLTDKRECGGDDCSAQAQCLGAFRGPHGGALSGITF